MTAAEKHIRKYLSLDGKAVFKKELSDFHAALKKDIDARRIDAHMPLGVECIDVEKRIRKALPSMNGKALRINVTKIDVDKILNAQKIQPKAESKKHPAQKDPGLAGKPLAKQEVKAAPVVANKTTGIQPGHRFTIFLKPPFDDYVKIHSDTRVMKYGLPGSGKTYDELAFAVYLVTKHNFNILYVSAEEYGRTSFDDKLKEHKIAVVDQNGYSTAFNGKLVFTDSLENLPPGKKPSDFHAFFLDSIDVMGMSIEDFRTFHKKQYKNHPMFLIKQTTKEGDFKGDQAWAHEVDVEIEVANRKRIFHKNRNDPGFMEKRDKLIFENKVKSKTDREKIRREVNQSMEGSGNGLGRPLATFIPDTIV